MSPIAANESALPELLERMIAAKQLSATDARALVHEQGRLGKAAALTEDEVLRWLAKEYDV